MGMLIYLSIGFVFAVSNYSTSKKTKEYNLPKKAYFLIAITFYYPVLIFLAFLVSFAGLIKKA